MRVLTQNSENIVYLTLSESTTIASPPYYLFRVVSSTTNEEVLFTAENISSAQSRYDEFVWTLTGSAFTNLTAGTINLPAQGEYKYYAYEQTSQTNVHLSGVTAGPIEQGLIFVSGTSLSFIDGGSYTGQSTTYEFYNPYQ